MSQHCWAVVLADGDGTPLQSLTHISSGDARPKQFYPVFGGKRPLTHTRERIAPLFAEDHSLFVVARAHESYFSDELADVPDSRKVIQPFNRGTAVAMALCLQSIIRKEEDALVAFFPSDHYYANPSAFRESINAGLRQASEYPNYVVTLGVEPRYSETEDGWIEPGRTLNDSLTHPMGRVARFWEKPDRSRARMLRRRGCLWNTSVTIGLASAFLEILRTAVPHLTRISAKREPLNQFFASVPTVDFSTDVLAVIPERALVVRDAALDCPRRVIGMRPAWMNDSPIQHGIYET